MIYKTAPEMEAVSLSAFGESVSNSEKLTLYDGCTGFPNVLPFISYPFVSSACIAQGFIPTLLDARSGGVEFSAYFADMI